MQPNGSKALTPQAAPWASYLLICNVPGHYRGRHAGRAHCHRVSDARSGDQTVQRLHTAYAVLLLFLF